MGLDLFRDIHVNSLRASVATNLRRYQSRRPWAERSAGIGPATFPSGLEPAVPLAFALPTSPRNLYDLDNAVLMHKAFPTLTRAQAGDPRLWTRLTHVEGWEYMRNRWDVTPHIADPAQAERIVLERYFIAGSRPSRAVTRNGMSRLWWYAHLTYRPERSDPYELTRVLLSTLDTAQQLLERNFGRGLEIRTGFLEYLRDHGTRTGETARQKRDRIRGLAEWLNRRGGVMLLDSLTADEVKSLLVAES